MPRYIVAHDSFANFRLAVLGNSYDMDGSYGAQCWDGVDLLYDQYGEFLYTARSFGGTSDAYTCWTNEQARAANTTTHFTPQVTNIEDVKQGDVVVFNPYGSVIGSTGHIAFAAEDYRGDGTLLILGQNQYPSSSPTTGGPFNEWRCTVASLAFIGGWKVAEWQHPGPTPTTSRKKFPWVLFANKIRARQLGRV